MSAGTVDCDLASAVCPVFSIASDWYLVCLGAWVGLSTGENGAEDGL